jgi:hypothetical protein
VAQDRVGWMVSPSAARAVSELRFAAPVCWVGRLFALGSPAEFVHSPFIVRGQFVAYSSCSRSWK